MFLKKENKSKKRKYKFKLTDYEALKLTEAITEVILMTLRDIDDVKKDEEIDTVVLYDLISKKYALMQVMKAFGSNVYQDELKSRKTIDKEIKLILEELDEKNKIILLDNSPFVVEKSSIQEVNAL